MHRKIFISHATEERRAVFFLADALKAHSHEVWVDEADLRLGDPVEEFIRGGLHWCDVFILCVSPTALQSRWVRFEARWLCENRKDGDIRMIPVRLVGSGVEWPNPDFPCTSVWEGLLHCDLDHGRPDLWSRQIARILSDVSPDSSMVETTSITAERWMTIWESERGKLPDGKQAWDSYRDRRQGHVRNEQELRRLLNVSARPGGSPEEIAARAYRYLLAYPVRLLDNYERWLLFAQRYRRLKMVEKYGEHGFAYIMTPIQAGPVIHEFDACNNQAPDQDFIWTKALATALGAVPCSGMHHDPTH
uniref:TIR domain-containing protein n=1 Tax=Candidatus Kentrum sp. DK TaxID=2126562 RepID=A0A450SY70_9GAMM|nr:MAG: TIR domain-containing protein [Candidatus Kentron sp. DK]